MAPIPAMIFIVDMKYLLPAFCDVGLIVGLHASKKLCR
jgi:hypothetical protein